MEMHLTSARRQPQLTSLESGVPLLADDMRTMNRGVVPTLIASQPYGSRALCRLHASRRLRQDILHMRGGDNNARLDRADQSTGCKAPL